MSVIVRWRGIPLQWARTVTVKDPISAYLCKRVNDGREQLPKPVQITAREKIMGNDFMSRALGHFQDHFPSLLLTQCLCVRPLSHSSHMEARAHIATPSHIDDVGYWSPFRRPPQAAAIFVKRVPPRRRRLLSRWDLFGIYFSHLINPRDLFH